MKRKELTAAEFEEYYGVYLATLEDETDLIEQLQKGYENFPKFIKGIPDEKLHFAYQDGKWTIAQVLLHIIDSERIFQYRAFRFSRNDKTALPGFNQDDYVIADDSGSNTKESIIDSYQIVRANTLDMFNKLDEQTLRNTGTASKLQWSVAGLGFVICGHQRHHRNIIRERYL